MAETEAVQSQFISPQGKDVTSSEEVSETRLRLVNRAPVNTRYQMVPAGANWNGLVGMDSRCVNNVHCNHSKANSLAREVKWCLRRLCKRYRCWTTLTEDGGVGTGGMGGGEEQRPSLLPVGGKQVTESNDPLQHGLTNCCGGCRLGPEGGLLGLSLEVIQSETLCVSKRPPPPPKRRRF